MSPSRHFALCLAAGFMAAMLPVSGYAGSPAPAPASAPVDHADWLDAKALQADFAASVEARHLTGGAAEARRASASAKWLPKLQAAHEAGDSMATLLLHDCTALPELNREQQDSTCSEDPQARDRARAILEATRGTASMTRLAKIANPFDEPADGCPKNDRDCAVRSSIDRLQEVKRLEIETGLLVTENALPRCPQGGKVADAELTRCLLLREELLALRTLAPRFFARALVEHEPDTFRTTQFPYANFGELRIGGTEFPAQSTLEGLEFYGRFYGDVYRTLQAFSAGVSSRMSGDPRWGLFLQEDRRDFERPTSAQLSKGRKAKLAAQREALQMQRFKGTYFGPLVSSGTTSVLTKLYGVQGGVAGRYLMISGHAPDAPVEFGTLGPCTSRASNEVLCIWRDKYGMGDISMLFNPAATEFKAWYGHLSEQAGFSRMDPIAWKEPALWGGKLQ